MKLMTYLMTLKRVTVKRVKNQEAATTARKEIAKSKRAGTEDFFHSRPTQHVSNGVMLSKICVISQNSPNS